MIAPAVLAVASVACLAARVPSPAPPGARADAAPRFRIEERVRVVVTTTPGATACLVHLHGNEVPARDVMLALAGRGADGAPLLRDAAHAGGPGGAGAGDAAACVNTLFLDDVRLGGRWQDDRIPVPNATMAAKKCAVNPNRVLTPAGLASRIEHECEGDDVARRELQRFLDETLLPALARCRGVSTQEVAGGAGLPVLAFHNHSNMTVRDFDAQKTHVARAGGPSAKHDLLLVTDARDYRALVDDDRFSVALQSAPPADDGSLSVLMQHARYVNVEAHILEHKRDVNLAMGAAALRVVGARACTPATD